MGFMGIPEDVQEKIIFHLYGDSIVWTLTFGRYVHKALCKLSCERKSPFML